MVIVYIALLSFFAAGFINSMADNAAVRGRRY
ncbi:MAG: hypothetical protein RL757_1618 [Bacteroidota bacterium]|jgi:hypothetical protein